MAEKSLNPDKLAKLSELVNVRRISDVETAPDTLGDEYSILNSSYILTSTNIKNKYINYKIRLNLLTDYLSNLSNNTANAVEQNFNAFIENLITNTSNSYIKFEPVDTNCYSFTINPKYSSISQDISYIDDTYTYVYTDNLTDGLINNAILEQYVRDTMGRILGVPNTKAEVDEAVNSVIEFVEWFKGYSKNDDGLTSLIQKINDKDNEIINSYVNADNEILNEAKSYTVENRELSYAYVESSYNLLYSAIQDIDVDVPVKGVSTTNKITIGNVTYILDLDNDKNLQLSVDIDNFVPFSVYVSGGSTTDYESYTYINGRDDITLTATANKECTWNNWTYIPNASVGESTQSNNGKTLTATGSHPDVGYCLSNVTFSWKVSASHTPTQDEHDHGHTNTENSEEQTASVKYTFNKFKSGVFASPQGIDEISFTEINYQPQTITTYGGTWKTESVLPSSFGTFTIKNSPNDRCYIYFLLPSNWVVSGKGFKWTGGEGMAETPGQANIRTLKLYNNTKNYTLFKSENKYPNDTNINFKYV